jgi:trimeric autotransporter adhesin
MPRLVLRHGLPALAIALLGLLACAAPPTPAVPAAPTLRAAPGGVKSIAFTWDAMAGATEYRLEEDLTGAGTFTAVATFPAGATSALLERFLPTRTASRYVLRACNVVGCAPSDDVGIAGLLRDLIGYVKATNTGAGDWFGDAVALSADGTLLAVGAAFEGSAATGIDGDAEDEGAPASGAVYLYARTVTGTWVPTAYVKASNTGANDRFGTSLALSADGSTLAIAAPREDGGSTGIGGAQGNDLAVDSGAVYVYTRTTGGGWTGPVYLKASNTGPHDRFGTAVALSADGTILAVGAQREGSDAKGVDGDQHNDDAEASGAVYVFGRNSAGAWTQQAYVKASNTQDGTGWFGAAVALSAEGRTLAVGSPHGGNLAHPVAIVGGGVYLYTRAAADVWSFAAHLEASNAQDHHEFGASVSLSADGTTLAVGAPFEDGGSSGVNGDQDDQSAPSSGAVYVYAANGSGGWNQQAYLKASTTRPFTHFGASVALSGDGATLVVGASGESSGATGIGGDEADGQAPGSGAVYLYTRSADGAWSQRAYVKAIRSGAGDRFGGAVSLSADAGTLAIGARWEDGGGKGVGGDPFDDAAPLSGAVYLY